MVARFGFGFAAAFGGGAAAVAPWLASGFARRIAPTTIRTTSSTAAIPLATNAAVRQGWISSSRYACSTGARDSLRASKLLPRQTKAFLERMLRLPAEVASRAAGVD